MKAIILAGGLGTRLSEETYLKPKPMVEIGGKPIIWHILKHYSHYGINDFIICCGYKGYVIKEYFANYMIHQSDVTFDLGSDEMHVHKKRNEDWKITLVDTGETSQTGGRLRRVKDLIDGTFCFTYGDGISDINLSELIRSHKMFGTKATVTAVMPPGRYGALNIDGTNVHSFKEKPQGDGSWINGGFFVLEPSVIDLIENDDTTWEAEPLRLLASQGELSAYKHNGFWRPMDTLRDKNQLEKMWIEGKAPWKIWK